MEGYSFTWLKSLGTDRAVEENLDRFMSNSDWCSFLSEARVKCLMVSTSNHYLILLYYEENSRHYRTKKEFKFENAWVT